MKSLVLYLTTLLTATNLVLTATADDIAMHKTSSNLFAAAVGAQTDTIRKTLTPLSREQLGQEPELASKVSFQVKSLPLVDLLNELKKQSGVPLSVADNASIRNARITARMREQPLFEVMSALSRLYDLRWKRAGDNSFQAYDSDLAEVEQQVLKLGNWQWLHYWQAPTRRSIAPKYLTLEPLVDWQTELLQAANAQDLASVDGVEISALPEELQIRLRQEVRNQLSRQMLESRYAASSRFLGGGTLRIAGLQRRPLQAVDRSRRAGSNAHPQPVVKILTAAVTFVGPNGPLNIPIALIASEETLHQLFPFGAPWAPRTASQQLAPPIVQK